MVKSSDFLDSQKGVKYDEEDFVIMKTPHNEEYKCYLPQDQGRAIQQSVVKRLATKIDQFTELRSACCSVSGRTFVQFSNTSPNRRFGIRRHCPIGSSNSSLES